MALFPATPYLLERSSGLYFRKAVPVLWRPMLGRELKRSLRTLSRLEAKAMAQHLSCRVECYLTRRTLEKLSVSLTPTEIKNLVDAWITKEIEDYREFLMEQAPFDRESMQEREYIQSFLLTDAKERLHYRDTSSVTTVAKAMVEEKGLPSSLGNDPTLLDALLHADVRKESRAYEVLVQGTTRAPASQQPPATSAPRPEEDKYPQEAPLPANEELIAEFLAEMKQRATSKSYREYETSFKVLIELVGKESFTELNRAKAVALRDRLLEYPNNRTKGAKKDLSLDEIQQRDDWKPISRTTANKHYSRWSGLMAWVAQWYRLDRNYLEGLAPDPNETPRLAWSGEDLDILFTKLPELATNNWRYWLPIMGLATGARIDELCGLRGSDVSKDEVWLINIENSELRRLKNKSSVRKVPIHQAVLDLGFVEFAKSCGGGLLFPELEAYQAEKLSHQPSKWFGSVKKGLGFGPELVFHSFRHLMREMLSEAEAQDSHIKAILGHEQGDETFGTYGGRIKPTSLDLHIQKLPIRQYLQGFPSFKTWNGRSTPSVNQHG